MRGIFVIAIALMIAYWADNQYFRGVYARETGDMLRQISASFKH